MKKQQNLKIFLIDKDKLIRNEILNHLSKEESLIFLDQENEKNLFKNFKNFNPNILVIGTNLQFTQIEKVIRYINKNKYNIPVIFLAHNEERKKLQLRFNVLSDNIVTKPIIIDELLEKIMSLKVKKDKNTFIFNGIKFHQNESVLIYGKKSVKLTEKENKILVELIKSEKDDISKEIIIQKVWEMRKNVATHVLESHIHRIRKKIKSINKNKIICTSSKGYYILKN